jgi:DNA-binding beta-propeller fold protein YncE
VYVGAESADLIHRIRLGPEGVSVDQTTPVGEMAIETEGPHGLNVSPDGQYLYMTTAHGIPDGKLWKFDAGPDTLVAAPILLGNFPSTLDLTPDGLYAFIVNFNLHGELVPSTVTVLGGERKGNGVNGLRGGRGGHRCPRHDRSVPGQLVAQRASAADVLSNVG